MLPLPKLKSLKIDNWYIDDLPVLKSLTKLTIESRYSNCNRLLTKLAENLNLVKLEFDMWFDAATFTILQSFRNLESLSLGNHYCFFTGVPKNTIFPSRLKQLKFRYVAISCTVFLSTVKQLNQLEEFQLERGWISCDNNGECKSFYRS